MWYRGIRWQKFARRHWFRMTLGAAAALGLVGLFFVPAVAPAVLKMQHWTADWRTAYLSDRRATSHPDLAIVTIDLEALQPFPFILPISRSLQADIVDALMRSGARAVALDFYYTKATVPEDDDKLFRVLSAHKDRLIIGFYEDARVFRPEQLAYQRAMFEKLDARAGDLTLGPDRDGVVRRRANSGSESASHKSFSSLIAKAAGREQPQEPEIISWLLPSVDGSDAILRIKAKELLNPSSNAAAQIKGRVVIVAGDMPYFDHHRTPLTISTGAEMMGAEIHAQMAAELIDGNRSYAELGPSQVRYFLGTLAIIAIGLGWRFRRRPFDFLDWRIASIIVLAGDALIFKFAKLVLPLTLAAYAWVLGVTLGTQLRGMVTAMRSLVPVPTAITD